MVALNDEEQVEVYIVGCACQGGLNVRVDHMDGSITFVDDPFIPNDDALPSTFASSYWKPIIAPVAAAVAPPVAKYRPPIAGGEGWRERLEAKKAGGGSLDVALPPAPTCGCCSQDSGFCPVERRHEIGRRWILTVSPKEVWRHRRGRA